MQPELTNGTMDFVIALSDKVYQLSISPNEENMEDVEGGDGSFVEQLKGVSHDINLVVGDKTIPAHKSMLVAGSEYFRAMFSGDFAEANRKEIIMAALSQEGLQAVIDALYTGRLNLTNTNVLEILKTADQLEIQDIIDCCEDFLVHAMDTANCFQLLQLSETYTLPRLNQEIEQFVLRNFPKVCQHPIFPSISQEALITFISNDELDFPEIDIFRGTMNWFTDMTDDSKSIAEVMKHIRFKFIASKDIVNEVLSRPIITENAKCRESVEDALQTVISYEEDVYSRPILETDGEKPRGKMSVVAVPPKCAEGDAGRMLNVPAKKHLIFFGIDNDDSVNVTDVTVGESQVDFAVFGMNILQLGHSVFFLGAQPSDGDGNDAKMTLLRFNVQSGEWITLQNPDFPPTVVSVSILHDNYIYFFGGAGYSNKKTIPQASFKKECYKYSIRNDTWSQIADYPHPVSHPAACVIGHEIFVVGGGGSNVNTQYRDRVYAYDTKNDTWTEKCSLNNGRAGHRICAVNGQIYVLGGRDPYRTDVPECEVYDPSQDLWTVLEKAPIPRSVASYAMVVHNDNITLLGGGCDQETRHPLVQTFNTKELNWTSYNWKNDHPDLLLSGSIHQLPLLRVRLSCCKVTNDDCQAENVECAANNCQTENVECAVNNCQTENVECAVNNCQTENAECAANNCQTENAECAANMSHNKQSTPNKTTKKTNNNAKHCSIQ